MISDILTCDGMASSQIPTGTISLPHLLFFPIERITWLNKFSLIYSDWCCMQIGDAHSLRVPGLTSVDLFILGLRFVFSCFCLVPLLLDTEYLIRTSLMFSVLSKPYQKRLARPEVKPLWCSWNKKYLPWICAPVSLYSTCSRICYIQNVSKPPVKCCWYICRDFSEEVRLLKFRTDGHDNEGE